MTETTPWLPLYDERQPAEIAAEYPNLRAMWAAAVERAPDQPAIRYFDGVLTVAELDAASDALAAGLQDLGFGIGDRIVLFLQNNPAFVLGMLAAWKAGGIAVAANPMYKNRELGHLVRDSGATLLLCLDELYEVAASAVAGSDVRTVVTCSARDFQTRDDPRLHQRATIGRRRHGRPPPAAGHLRRRNTEADARAGARRRLLPRLHLRHDG